MSKQSRTSTHFEVTVFTNQYTGNFERELAAFVFGATEYDGGREEYAAHSPEGRAHLAWAYEEDADFNKLVTQHNEDFGIDVWSTLWNRYSSLLDDKLALTEDEQQGITFRFEDIDIQSWHLEGILQRALSFPAAYSELSVVSTDAVANLKITGIQAQRVSVTTERETV